MNKKFISALLFGAMLIASTSTFVSCSYDDDITDLRNDLNATATDLNGLVDQKMKAVDAEIASLGAQADALEAAYEAADEALEEAIANATNDAKGYADVQAAQAQAAAIAAAQKMVSDAQAALEAALTAVNTTLGEHGKSISALLEADKQLTSAIAAAQARADQAYALAEQAQKLATDNAAAIKSLNEALEALKKTVANLEGQVSVLGEKVTALEKEAQAQAAEIAAQKAALKALEESNAKALDAAVKAAKDELLKEIEANSKKVADLEEKLAAAEAAAQAAVDAAKTALEAQIAEVAKKLAAESAAYTDEKFAEALEAAQAAQKDATDALTQLKDLASKTELAEAAAKVQAAAAAAQAAADEAKAALKGLEDADKALAARIKALEDVKDAYKAADDSLKADLQKAITDAVAVLKTELMGEIAKVNANLAYQGKKLKSLVFSPELYYQGIEAVPVYSFEYLRYKPLTAGNVEINQVHYTNHQNKVNDNQVDDKSENYTHFVPNEKISYIMNPSNAVVSTDVAKYGFIVNNATYTRATPAFGADNVKVKNVETTKDGKLTLTINMTNPERIAALNTTSNPDTYYPTSGKVDVMALKYTDKGESGDTTIVSDFAAIKHYKVTEFQIRNKVYGCVILGSNPEKAVDNYMYRGQQGYIGANYLSVAYDGRIDLDEKLDVHYKVDGARDHIEWGNGKTIREKNFRFEYELMGYIANDQTGTNESKHAKLDGSVLIPQNADGSKANRSAVGRTPLVRVKLIDGNNSDNIVAVGYVIVVITDVDLDPISFSYGSNKAFEVVCGNTNFEIGYMPTWTQFEQDILSHEKVQLSKADFHKLYELETDANGAIQYKAIGSTEKVADADRFGKVILDDNTAAFETHVLKWTVENNVAYQWFKNGNNGKGNTQKQIIVRFVPQAVAYDYPAIYVTLTWTPSALELDPVASLDNKYKVESVWYAEDSNDKGYSDLHAHVNPDPNDLNNVNFVFNPDNSAFRVDNKVVALREAIAASLVANGFDANDKALANATADAILSNGKVVYNFATVKEQGVFYPAYNRTAESAKGGIAYTLTVENGTHVYAHNKQTAKTLIAWVNTSDGVITYEKNDVAKDILNYAHSEKLAKGQTLTLQVVVTATTCAPANNINLANNKFNVKFVRPLNLEEKDAVKIVDSKLNKQEIFLGKGKDKAYQIKFTDWRGYDSETIYANSGNKYNIYKLYGIKSILQDDSRKVQSDFVSGTMADIDEKLFSFEYEGVTDPTTSTDQGKITYTKNTTFTVHDFKVRIPVVVEYVWGKVYGWINVDIAKTDGNN